VTAACPYCGRAWPEERDELEQLRLLAGELGILIDVDDTVDEAGAARLLDRSPKTLRNWRTEVIGPDHVKRGSRVRYPIANLIANVPPMSREI
jgi:hypothetical protein